MFDTICDVIVGLIAILIAMGGVFVFICLGYKKFIKYYNESNGG